MQALDFVQAQPLPIITWDDLVGLIAEAPRRRRPTLRERIAAEEAAFDPDAEPARANEWMQGALGVDQGVLRRLHSRFAYCQRGGVAPRGSLMRSVKSCAALMAAMHGAPLHAPGAAPPGGGGTPRSWADVLVDLECHELDALSWCDVLEVVRWNRELELGIASPEAAGPSGHRRAVLGRRRGGQLRPRGAARCRAAWSFVPTWAPPCALHGVAGRSRLWATTLRCRGPSARARARTLHASPQHTRVLPMQR